MNLCVVLVTHPDKTAAWELGKKAVQARLAACAQLEGPIQSVYTWKGIETCSTEYRMLLKTRRACLGALEELIRREHPFETPQWVVLEGQASEDYASWVSASTDGSLSQKD